MSKSYGLGNLSPIDLVFDRDSHVRKHKVYNALKWLVENHEDYKNNVTIDEERINIIFMGDFLQLAIISHLDVYVDKRSEWEYGHHLWRSINLVVLLTEQMRQSDDPEFAAALRRIRFHEPTLEDIEMLNSRIDASLECPISIPIVVHCHSIA